MNIVLSLRRGPELLAQLSNKDAKVLQIFRVSRPPDCSQNLAMCHDHSGSTASEGLRHAG